jgi:hypothetical protein
MFRSDSRVPAGVRINQFVNVVVAVGVIRSDQYRVSARYFEESLRSWRNFGTIDGGQ